VEAFGRRVKSEEEEAMRETVGGSLLCDSSPVLKPEGTRALFLILGVQCFGDRFTVSFLGHLLFRR